MANTPRDKPAITLPPIISTKDFLQKALDLSCKTKSEFSRNAHMNAPDLNRYLRSEHDMGFERLQRVTAYNGIDFIDVMQALRLG